jgi:hypothetical protein
MRCGFSLSLAVRLGALIFLSNGCGDGSHPSGPTSPAPTPPEHASPTFTLSGVVLDYTAAGPQPRSGVPLIVRSWGRPGPLLEYAVTSGANGQYEISGIPVGAVTIQPSTKADYRAPCPPGTNVLNYNANFYVNVASTALLSTAGAPEAMPRSGIWISGVVFERTSEGTRPIAGAAVDLEDDEMVYASTLTDSAGQFLVCTSPPGTGTDQLMWLQVEREAFSPGGRVVYPGWNYTAADVELVRN